MRKECVFCATLTSIAAAYCDLEEYEKARQFCDIAYAEWSAPDF